MLAGRTHDPVLQFTRYLLIGGAAAALDSGTLYILHAHLGVGPLVAATIGFLLGLTLNYFVCAAWVFHSRGRARDEFTLFALIGIGGLAWTELILWVAIEAGGIPVMGERLEGVAEEPVAIVDA